MHLGSWVSWCGEMLRSTSHQKNALGEPRQWPARRISNVPRKDERSDNCDAKRPGGLTLEDVTKLCQRIRTSSADPCSYTCTRLYIYIYINLYVYVYIYKYDYIYMLYKYDSVWLYIYISITYTYIYLYDVCIWIVWKDTVCVYANVSVTYWFAAVWFFAQLRFVTKAPGFHWFFGHQVQNLRYEDQRATWDMYGYVCY